MEPNQDDHVIPKVPDVSVDTERRATLEFKQFQDRLPETEVKQLKRELEEVKDKRNRERFDTFKWVISILMGVIIAATSIVMFQLSNTHGRIDLVNRELREIWTRLATAETILEHGTEERTEATLKEAEIEAEENIKLGSEISN